jgi:hypothetical protein
MNYYRDVLTLRRGSVADETVEFAAKRPAPADV